MCGGRGRKGLQRRPRTGYSRYGRSQLRLLQTTKKERKTETGAIRSRRVRANGPTRDAAAVLGAGEEIDEPIIAVEAARVQAGCLILAGACL